MESESVKTGDMIGLIATSPEAMSEFNNKINSRSLTEAAISEDERDMMKNGQETSSTPLIELNSVKNVTETPSTDEIQTRITLTSSDPSINQSHINQEVSDWLSGVSEEYLTDYQRVFFEEGFDTLDAVKTLRKEDLIEMGVKKGHRRVLLAAIEELNKTLDE